MARRSSVLATDDGRATVIRTACTPLLGTLASHVHPRRSTTSATMENRPSRPSCVSCGAQVRRTGAKRRRRKRMPWPSGLRRQLQALVRKGAGSNPAAVKPGSDRNDPDWHSSFVADKVGYQGRCQGNVGEGASPGMHRWRSCWPKCAADRLQGQILWDTLPCRDNHRTTLVASHASVSRTVASTDDHVGGCPIPRFP
eukprot:scaffold1440_cov332-Pavlova_lutheri.AAC.23